MYADSKEKARLYRHSMDAFDVRPFSIILFRMQIAIITIRIYGVYIRFYELGSLLKRIDLSICERVECRKKMAQVHLRPFELNRRTIFVCEPPLFHSETTPFLTLRINPHIPPLHLPSFPSFILGRVRGEMWL